MNRRTPMISAAVAAVALLGASAVTGEPAVATTSVTIAAVGDIACKNPPGNNVHACQYDDVSDLIAGHGYDAFIALGDEQYEYGRYLDFVQNYDAYFGRLLPTTYPVPGNHEYGTTDAAGYFRYFGAAARNRHGWYSFDLGSWHVIALNSAVCHPYSGEPCGPGTPQYEWLRRDLVSHPSSEYRCTLAYWHHPLFDWEKYQNNKWVQSFDYDRGKPFWKLLQRAGADVVLTGHNHNYQRYLPMDADGTFDPTRGIVEFIVGTGGRNTNALGSVSTRPPTFVTGQGDAMGILSMTLGPGSYSWRWIAAPGQPTDFIDAGSTDCH
jgi:Calcineurin-like phosphoesterase